MAWTKIEKAIDTGETMEWGSDAWGSSAWGGVGSNWTKITKASDN